MRRNIVSIIVLLGILSARGGNAADAPADTAPKSIQSSISKYDRSLQQAVEEYRKKTGEARAKLITDIDAAVKDVAKRGDQQELERLIEYKKSLPPLDDDPRSAFSVKHLVNRPLDYFKIRQPYARLTLMPDGTISSTTKLVNEKTWRVSKEGALQFVNEKGQVTSEYKDCLRSGPNLFLWGPYVAPADGSMLGLASVQPETAK